MDAVATVRMSGPLTCHVEGFAAELRSCGYTELSLANQLRLMADLSRWLEVRGLDASEIDGEVRARFLAKRRQTHTQFTTERAIAPLLRYLTSIEAVSVPMFEPSRRSRSLSEYERYLVEERGVSARRLGICLAVAEDFLDGRHVSRLKAEDVTRVIDSRPAEPNALSALRSLLRFLFITSKIKRNLVHAVPSCPRWRLASLPKFLDASELDAVFATCDRRTEVGVRDYAVLVLLARLGLRACEVAALQLEDIEWTRGELEVRGKGSVGRLPMPSDVGEALVAYLRRATRSRTTRAVFVCCRAPYTALTAAAVIGIARGALELAGLQGGAHRLRHTVATQMLRQGASLTEIAQVLRHRHVDTTAIYAKVDRDALRSIARVWPVGQRDVESLRELVQTWPGGAP
jgi:site-specific recombinase XerD